MMNHERISFRIFRGALRSVGRRADLGSRSYVELRDHMQHCAHCRSAHADFIDILHNKLPLVDPELKGPSKPAGFFSETSSYRERFLTRARKARSRSFTRDFARWPQEQAWNLVVSRDWATRRLRRWQSPRCWRW